jgi:hypothetical protein
MPPFPLAHSFGYSLPPGLFARLFGAKNPAMPE